MINKAVIEQFIKENSHLDVPSLALQLSKKPELPSQYIINQIQGRKMAKIKLPEWDYSNIQFPDKRAMEQCSSSITGNYKATQVVKGHYFVDLTGGMGVDTYYLGKLFDEITYVEANPELFKISQANLRSLLKEKRLIFENESAENFLLKSKTRFDLIYLDPDRRVGGLKKGVKIEDCSPNLIEIEDQLIKLSKQVMVKFSPLLDIKQAIQQLKSITKVSVVSINNDCKELIFKLSNKKIESTIISCINFTQSGEEQFVFTYEDEEKVNNDFSNPLTYLYEPNASILKAGAFKSLGSHFGIKKIAINSHFYTSKEKVLDFPGRTFEVIKETNQIKGLSKKANIISRNHPLSAEEIKKKGKIKDGGTDYIIATRLQNNKPLFILCNRIWN